jgi:MoaA/NifB/PqqE/SkfB family radical SAM enzyme
MSNFYCAAPWRSLHITPQGDVKTCCAGNNKVLNNLNKQSIETIINSPVLKEIRQSIKQGIAPAYCNNCVQAEKFGVSERDWHNTVNPEFNPATSELDDYCPTLLDIRWNTTCNLSCNYCDEVASSKWANIKKIPASIPTRKYYADVCNYIAPYQERIRRVALIGGEPLLLPENETLLDVIPTDCPITLITNLSVNLENNKIFKKLLTKSNVAWHVSFENLGPQFEYVRHGASWEVLEKNMQTLRLLRGTGHWESIHAVYSLYNATQLVELVNWGKNQELNFNWQGLHRPNYLNPLFHNHPIRKIAMEQLDQVLCRSDLTHPEQTFLTQTRANFDAPQEKNLTQEFLEYTNNLEIMYHPDQQGQFAKLWPEIYTELNT